MRAASVQPPRSTIDCDRAESVFVPCAGFRTAGNIAKLEADIGKPVITSNQATLADCLRILSVGDVWPGLGSLFDRLRPRDTVWPAVADKSIAAE